MGEHRMTLAVTGGTGFVGGHVIEHALAAGHAVRALTRREQPDRDGVTWVAGALEDGAALIRLASGADAVIHVAGIVNAPDRDGFERGNVAGTRNMLDAAQTAGVARFVHVSSLAAREPALSAYGASKAGAEDAVRASDRAWTIVRPPAIYGPGDMEMRELFRIAKLGIALLPPPGMLSVIAVADLAALLVALSTTSGPREILEADDGREDGWTHSDFARAIGKAVGQARIMPMSLPRPLLSLAARIDGMLRGRNAKLTADRVAYFCHPDWRIDTAARPDPAFWTPRIATPDGLADTAQWYRARGLL